MSINILLYNNFENMHKLYTIAQQQLIPTFKFMCVITAHPTYHKMYNSVLYITLYFS